MGVAPVALWGIALALCAQPALPDAPELPTGVRGGPGGRSGPGAALLERSSSRMGIRLPPRPGRGVQGADARPCGLLGPGPAMGLRRRWTCSGPPCVLPRRRAGTGGGLGLRGGGRPTKLVEKAKTQEHLIKTVGRERKVRYKAGTRGYVPFAGPRLYALGGRSTKYDLATVQSFDAKTDSWSLGLGMELKRAAAAAVGMYGRIYVLGGTTGGLHMVDSIDVFTPHARSPAWATEAKMPFPRRLFAACALGGCIYVVGGAGMHVWNNRTANDASHASVFRYDVRGRAWANATSLPTGRRHHAAAALGGRVYVVGGWRGNCGPLDLGENLNEVLSWEPGEEVWRREMPMPTVRRSLQLVALAGKLYAIGGVDGGKQLDVVESFNPANGTWSKEEPIKQKRSSFAAAAFNGKIYIAGGLVGGAELDSVEVFDPFTRSWSTSTKLPQRRWALNLAAA